MSSLLFGSFRELFSAWLNIILYTSCVSLRNDDIEGKVTCRRFYLVLFMSFSVPGS